MTNLYYIFLSILNAWLKRDFLGIFDTGDYIRRQSVSEERRAKGID